MKTIYTHQAFITMATQHPLSEVDRARAYYKAAPQDENIAAIAVASAKWNFTPDGVDAGLELLARMPYNGAAIAWSAANFDTVYRAIWWLLLAIGRHQLNKVQVDITEKNGLRRESPGDIK